MIDAVIERAERLCRTIAGRDLAGAPIYIVCQSQLPARFGSEDGSEGYTCPRLDLYLKDHIGAAWRGRGPAMVINDRTLAAELHPDDVGYVILATVLHELAHILERRTLAIDATEFPEEPLQFEVLALARETQPERPIDEPAFAGHQAAFIRTALHVCNRAAMAGTVIEPSAVFNGWQYGLTRTRQYAATLGDEPQRMPNKLFREILATDPPLEFLALWAADESAYARR